MPLQHQRRQFLKYWIGGGLGAIAWGFLRPLASHSKEANLESPARDRSNKPLFAKQLLSTSTPGLPILVQGLPEKKTAYLVITQGPKLAAYAIRPVCTHQGCTVDWNAERQRFVCPCHGAQFDNQGRVLKGPAKKALALVTVVVKQDQVRLVDRAPAPDPRTKV